MAESNQTYSSDLLPYVSVGDVLKDLPDNCEPTALNFNNHTARIHRPSTIEHFKTIPQGIQVKKSYRYRAPWDGPSHSLTAGMDSSTKSYIHPIYHREMSVREYARIHGFPDTWIFSGTRSNGLKQVANAVPVLLAESVLRSIINFI